MQEVREHYTEMRKILWSGITSMSRDFTVAKDQFARENGIVFKITTHSARDVSKFSSFPGELEVCLLLSSEENFSLFNYLHMVVLIF